mmetsp:Transcript_45331/g.45886  ORF Transcript_45331/g.45886 Transcript_45331/m.45886 type:complete len:112 (+) Transcript_45331:97-432(+)
MQFITGYDVYDNIDNRICTLFELVLPYPISGSHLQTSYFMESINTPFLLNVIEAVTYSCLYRSTIYCKTTKYHNDDDDTFQITLLIQRRLLPLNPVVIPFLLLVYRIVGVL